MDIFRVIVSVSLAILAVGMVIIFLGYVPNLDPELVIKNIDDAEAWHRVKSVWLPTLLGWLLMLQLPVSSALLGFALWLFYREQKLDRLRSTSSYKAAEKERAKRAEEAFNRYIEDLNPRLVEALRHEKIAVKDDEFLRDAKLTKQSAYEWFVDKYRGEVIWILEEQVSAPAEYGEFDDKWELFSSPWITWAEALTKSALILSGIVLAGLLGYALVFI